MVKITVRQAARLMNKSPQFVRIALQRKLVPFGFAAKMDENGTRYNYYINPSKLYEYLGITEEDVHNELTGEERTN